MCLPHPPPHSNIPWKVAMTPSAFNSITFGPDRTEDICGQPQSLLSWPQSGRDFYEKPSWCWQHAGINIYAEGKGIWQPIRSGDTVLLHHTFNQWLKADEHVQPWWGGEKEQFVQLGDCPSRAHPTLYGKHPFMTSHYLSKGWTIPPACREYRWRIFKYVSGENRDILRPGDVIGLKRVPLQKKNTIHGCLHGLVGFFCRPECNFCFYVFVST